MARSFQPRPLPRLRGAVGAFLLAAVLLVCPTARAEMPSAPRHHPVVAAGIGKYLSNWSTRSGVIKIALVTMCLGLFILMKKFTDVDGTPGRRRPTTDR